MPAAEVYHTTVHKAYCVAAAKAMRSLLEFMATDKAIAGLSKTLTIYGQAFNRTDAFAPVLQVICLTLLKHIAIGLSCFPMLLPCVSISDGTLTHKVLAVRSRQVHPNQLCGNHCQLA